MRLFVALLDFTEDEELRQRMRPAHREYLQSLLRAGKLAMSGPWANDTGAMLVYRAEDHTDAERLLAEDPYRSAGVVADAQIKEWQVVLQAASIEEWGAPDD